MTRLFIDLALLILFTLAFLTAGTLGIRYAGSRRPTAVALSRSLMWMFAILAALAIVLASAVIAGHGNAVRHGALAGAWAGALIGAWLATRRPVVQMDISKALLDGLAETLDGALVGAVVGGFLLNAGEAWKGAALGVVIAIAGWIVARAYSLPHAAGGPLWKVTQHLVATWVEVRQLDEENDRAEIDVLSITTKAVLGALWLSAGMSLALGSLAGWWSDFPLL